MSFYVWLNGILVPKDPESLFTRRQGRNPSAFATMYHNDEHSCRMMPLSHFREDKPPQAISKVTHMPSSNGNRSPVYNTCAIMTLAMVVYEAYKVNSYPLLAALLAQYCQQFYRDDAATCETPFAARQPDKPARTKQGE
jgi:hypothetical protein